MTKYLIKVLIILSNIFVISCGGSSPTQPTDSISETKELKEFMVNLNTALKNSDSDAFISYFSKKSSNYYSKAISANKSKLPYFAKILENRKLIAYDSLYAVYEITYQGMTFEISMFLDDDGKWKIKDM
jgi:hypothetical protein